MGGEERRGGGGNKGDIEDEGKTEPISGEHVHSTHSG